MNIWVVSAIGRVNRGKIRQGQTVAVMTREGGMKQARIEKLFGFQGLKRIEIEEALQGILLRLRESKISILAKRLRILRIRKHCQYLKIDEPTLQMTFLVNNQSICRTRRQMGNFP